MCGCHRAPQGTVSSLLMEGQRLCTACSRLAVVKPGMHIPFGPQMHNPGDLEYREELGTAS